MAVANSRKGFKTWGRISESFNALSVAIVLFLLISYIFLPVEKSRRHYLSVCLVIGIGLLSVSKPHPRLEGAPTDRPQLGFVVPLAAQPEQCYNEITPNDMYSNLTCAWSGAFIISGSLTTGMWSKFANGVMSSQSNANILMQSLFARSRCTCRFAGMLFQARSSSTRHRVEDGL